MTMPEATVDENNRLVFLQHNVRRSGQFTVVDTIAQTSGEEILPHNQFRLSILSLDSRHATAALLRCHHICHNCITKLAIIFMRTKGYEYEFRTRKTERLKLSIW